MKKLIYYLIVCMVIFPTSCCREESMDQLTQRAFNLASGQLLMMAESLPADLTPRSFENGVLVTDSPQWWCSGFFPGSLWIIYEYTQDQRFADLAIRETMKIEEVKTICDHHDVGFQIGCSFGNWYRLTQSQKAHEVMSEAATSLSCCFDATLGCMRSWPFVLEGFDWDFPVIIDNMMNLELLMTVAKLDNNEELAKIAVSHADKTLENHFRNDFTCCHLVDYDHATGNVNKKITVQGYADNSAWARGQAWALYGYTMMYGKTGQGKYLEQACGIADMLIKKLPADGIPWWDFNAPDIPDALRDASAGAVMASAFATLHSFKDKDGVYLKMAERQLRTLCSDEYLSAPGENGGFILKHSVGHHPAMSEVDVPLTYADYYFLEALLRYRNSAKNGK